MQVDELKQAMASVGHDPKNLNKSAMQEILMQKLLTGGTEGAAASAGATSSQLPPFFSKLAPELQLQWWMRQEEKQAAEAKALQDQAKALQDQKAAEAKALLDHKAAEAKALLEHQQAVERFKLENEAKVAATELALNKLKLENEAKAAAAAAAFQADAEKREAAFASAKLDAELRVAEHEAQRAHEIKLKELSLQDHPPQGPPPFRLDQAIKLLPRFSEKNVEEYLITFEKIAEINNWPVDRYASVLQSMLVGKGLRVFAELPKEDCQDYEKLSRAILNAYAVVSEVHRTRFRAATKQPGETFSDFAFTLGLHFKRWIEGEKAFEDLNRIKEVIKLEQFYERLHPEMRAWLNDKAPETLERAATLSDEYTALRKANQRGYSQPIYNRQKGNGNGNSGGGPRPTSGAPTLDAPKFKVNETKMFQGEHPPGKAQNKYANVTCHYCHKKGHIRSQCFQRMRAEGQHTEPSSMHCVGVSITDETKVVTDDKTSTDAHEVNPLFATHWCTATLTRPDGKTGELRMLRDTGSLQSLLSRARMKDGDYIETGECRLIRGISGNVIRIPLIEVQLTSMYGEGKFLCGLVDSLPDPAFDGLIGNDLDPPSSRAEDVTPVHVVTRSQTRLQPPSAVTSTTQNTTEVNNGPASQVSSTDSDNTVPDPLTTEVSRLFHSPAPHTRSLSLSSVTSEMELIKLQHNDPSLSHLFALVQPRTSDLDGKTLFFLENGVLMRAWRDKEMLNIPGTECTQIVLPYCLRAAMLRLAHDIPAAAHLGMAKTKQRLDRHFYWPSLSQDIKRYVRSCDVCQRLGKGGKPPPASLHNLPVMSEPFSRIAIDIVGPLPKCRDTGNRFILTIIDHCTHFPEAVPLVTHEAADVAKALITVFSRYGFVDEILSDCGSEFMSKLMAIFLKEFGISRIRTSPYHPATNGSCERFNGTLKAMIRAVCDDYPDTWDQTLPWVLFAYREVPVETLGFSPFELLYARTVTGPLALVKKAWLKPSSHVNSPVKSVIQFVLDMRERLRTAIQQANEHATQQKSKSKKWFDRKARDRSFEVNQEILALLPLPGNPLQAKYCGPYRVLEKLGPVDYLIDTPNRRKTKRVCHVNLLKPYRRRDEKLFPKIPETSMSVYATGDVEVETQDFGNSIPSLGDIHQSTKCDPKPEGLTENQQKGLTALLAEFADIFKDTPGHTTLITHHIELLPDSKPVVSAPYRLHPEKAAAVEKEIKDMLDLRIIEPSDSPWASPIVLVPKPDGSIRLCTDYRRVNTLTVADPFPFPRIEDLVDKVGRAKFLTKVDMTRGYWQVPLDDYSGPISAFVTPTGHFQWRFLPFGLRNAPATFSRLVIKLLKGLENFSGAYLDDVIIFSDTWEEHLQHLTAVFERIRQAGLTLNKKKCEFACAELDYLGHHVGRGQVEPRRTKVEALLAFPRPTTRKQIQSFLGLGGYYRRYIPHFASLSSTLSDLLKKGTKFVWDSKAEEAFLDIKSRLASKPVLIAPNFDKPFIIGVDASDTAIGATLMQEANGLERPICYISRKLNAHQKRYATVEKEALALLTAVRAFSIYFGSAKTIVFSDHSPLQFLNKMAPHNQKLLRWCLELQQYNLEVRHRAGRENLLPDILSRPSE